MPDNNEIEAAPMLTQFLIFSILLIISSVISSGIALIFPNFPVPTPLIALVLLFCCLTTGVIKLEQVEGLSKNLLSIIGLLFVPSGISLANSLNLLQEEGIKIVVVVILATIVLLLSVAYSSRLIGKIENKISHREK